MINNLLNNIDFLNILFFPLGVVNWISGGRLNEGFYDDGFLTKFYLKVISLVVKFCPGILTIEMWFLLLAGIYMLLCIVGLWILGRWVLKRNSSLWKKVFWMTVLASILYFVVISAFWGMIIQDEMNNPVSSRYAPLNAALKNTCSGNDKIHCPKTKEELLGLDSSFESIVEGKKYWYELDPTTLRYTLIIQDEDWKGVIFDPRLSTMKNENGLALWDFKDIQMSGCKVTNPPEFDGLWNNLCRQQ